MSKYKNTILAIGLISLAAFLAVFQLSKESLWADEGFSAGIVHQTYTDIWEITRGDSHPPGYYAALKLYTGFFGYSKFSLRLFSAFGYLSLFLLGYFPLRKLFNWKTSHLFALLLLFSPGLLSFAREIRMYTWANFFVLGTALFCLLAIRDKKWKDWILFTLCLVSAMYIHYYALLSVFFINLFIFIYLTTKRREILLPYLISAGIAVVLYMPWILSFLTQLERHFDNFWIPDLTINTVLTSFTSIFSLKAGYSLYSMFQMIFLVALCVSGSVKLIRRKEKDSPLSFVFLFTYVMVIFFVVIISIVKDQSYLISRYMTIPGVLVLASGASGFGFVLERKKLIWNSIVIFGLSIPAIISIFTIRFNGPMNEVREFILTEVEADDVFVHFNEHTASMFAVEFPENYHLVYNHPEVDFYFNFDAYKPSVDFREDFVEIVDKHNRVWVVDITINPSDLGYKEVSKYLEDTKSKYHWTEHPQDKERKKYQESLSKLDFFLEPLTWVNNMSLELYYGNKL